MQSSPRVSRSLAVSLLYDFAARFHSSKRLLLNSLANFLFRDDAPHALPFSLPRSRQWPPDEDLHFQQPAHHACPSWFVDPCLLLSLVAAGSLGQLLSPVLRTSLSRPSMLGTLLTSVHAPLDVVGAG